MILTIKRTTNGNSIGKGLIDTYHSYIKYASRPAREIYYDLYEDGEICGTIAFSSAFTWNGQIKDYMQLHNIEFNELANNIVYCLGPHKDKNAGSRFLKLCRNDAINWWYSKYGDVLKCFQTFIEPPRTGAVYKADNWEFIGNTEGSGFKTETISKEEFDAKPEQGKKSYIKYTYKDGPTIYTTKEKIDVQKKLIFMKRTSEKEIRRALQKTENKFW